jgi:hypothetical protein
MIDQATPVQPESRGRGLAAADAVLDPVIGVAELAGDRQRRSIVDECARDRVFRTQPGERELQDGCPHFSADAAPLIRLA